MVEKIGRYEIRGELGRGGMATVYRGYDPGFGREVAVKVLPASFLHDPSFRSRFEREARTIAALEHPAIVPVYDVGEHEGQPYLVMRLMRGSLEERLREGPLTLAEAATLFTRLAGALDQAHAQGIVHRDLKPGNILFDAYGAPYISDFGIVKLSEASEKLSMSGSVMGTPSYMSPEQAHGDRALDGRSDIYTMGVILFEVLTGQTPYQAETPIKMMMKHVMEPVPRILAVNPNLPGGAEVIIARAMAKEPADRYATATEMAQALTDLAHGRLDTGNVPATVVTPPVPLPSTPSVPAATEVLPSTPATPLPATPHVATPPPVAPAPPAGIPPMREQPVSSGGSNKHLWLGGGVAATLLLLVCSCVGLGMLIDAGVVPRPPTATISGAAAPTTVSGTPEAPPSPPVIAVAATEETDVAAEPAPAEPPPGGAPPPGGLPPPAEAPPPIGVEDTISIQDAADIGSFHLSISLVGLGEAFEGDEEFLGGQMFVEADVVQDPPGYSLVIQAPLMPPPNRFEFIRTGPQAFGNAGEGWSIIPPEEAPDVEELLFLDEQDIRAMEGLTFVGIEEVNSRRTVHFQGREEALATLGDEGEFEEIEAGQIDLWLDERSGFVVKLDLTASGVGVNQNFPDAQGTINVQIEYSAFNVELFFNPPIPPP